MYRHLLVPIDDTELSSLTVGRAIEFARALAARITFFHARISYAPAAGDDQALLRATTPEDIARNFQGRTRELLTKADAAARAQAVTSAVVASTSDAPHRAILAAARAEKCDLIFMASHGRRSDMGMMLGSQTLRVLMNSAIPVLVASTQTPPVPALAIGIIRDEHRSLAAVLHAWLRLGRDSLAPGGKPLDPQLLRAMLHYLKAYPLALHHPKETHYLFARLRARSSEYDAELDELARQHGRDQQLVDALAAAVDSYCAGGFAAIELDAAVNRYASFMWEHMGREEAVILPAAQREFDDDDWAAVNAAFSQHQDPRFGGNADAEFWQLYTRIIDLGAAPDEQ